MSKQELDRRLFIKTASGIVLGTAISLVAPSRGQAQTGKLLKIGCTGPFTGPNSRSGDEMKLGTMMAIEDARASGQLPVTIDGQKRDVEIVWVDNQSSPEKAVKALTSAIEREGVEFLVNGLHSSVTLAFMEVLSPTKIVWIGDTGGSLAIDDKINKAPGKYRGFFKGWPAAPVMASLYITPLKYFLEKGLWKPKNRKAVVTVEDTDWGRSWGAAMKNKLAEIMEVVGMDAMPLDAVEHTPLLTRYQATGVSLVASTWTSDVTVSSFVKQFHAMGLKALLIADGITNVGEWYKLMGNASNGALNCALAVLTPDQKAWVARYREKYKAEPGLDTAGLAFDYTLMGIKGLSQAGTLQFDKVVRTFETLEYKGVWNLYKFSTAAGPRALAPHEVEVGDLMQGFFFPVEQMENGQAKVIWPLNYAAGAFVPPPGG